ncbi:MAG TPA: 4Fe-4S binding protein [Anaerolineae bacterium]|nr:4Fe-4S binding protein [Anaerolineae bacterium]
MIVIDIESCTGCGACMEACPTGAIYLVEGKATIDEALCRGCEACLPACPSGAIYALAQARDATEPARLPARRPEPSVIHADAPSALTATRFKLLPALGAALVWIGRELLPSLLDLLDRRASQPQAGGGTGSRSAASTAARSGWQRRHRKRGGNS